MPKKYKHDGYVTVFIERLEKLKKDIKKARKAGTLKKEHCKRLVAEAKELRDYLAEDE